jgi:hypothetical protein
MNCRPFGGEWWLPRDELLCLSREQMCKEIEHKDLWIRASPLVKTSGIAVANVSKEKKLYYSTIIICCYKKRFT